MRSWLGASPRSRGWDLQVLLVAASVLLTVLAYPPTSAWLAGCVMFAPLVYGLERLGPRSAFLLFYAYSAAMALVIGRWVVHALAVEYELAVASSWAFLLLLVGGYALIPAAAAWLYRRLRGGVPLLLAPLLFAGIWSLAEWLRAEPGGLPWLLAAHVLAPLPVAIQIADLGGIHAVGFGVAALGAGLGLAAARRRATPLLLPVALALGSVSYGTWRLQGLASPEDPVRVGVVQASVPQSERFQPGSADRNAQHHAELTRALAGRGPLDLVVWSETAVDSDLDATPRLGALLAGLVREIGIPLVTGAPRSEAGRPTNSVVLFSPDAGLVESYDKQRLVPFSEYDPPFFRWLEPLMGPVAAGDPYVPGEQATVFRRAPISLSTPVCFEITYPRMMRRFRAEGAELIVNLSNDAWFGRSGYARMHFLHAIFRAVELRTWLVRGANTGISGVIDPAGRVVASLPVFEEGTLVANVGRAGAPPFYARQGDGPVLLVCATLVGWIALRARRRAPRP